LTLRQFFPDLKNGFHDPHIREVVARGSPVRLPQAAGREGSADEINSGGRNEELLEGIRRCADSAGLGYALGRYCK